MKLAKGNLPAFRCLLCLGFLFILSGFSRCDRNPVPSESQTGNLEEKSQKPVGVEIESSALADSDISMAVKRQPPEMDRFAVVADSNLFHPDRQNTASDQTSETPPTPQPQVTTELPDLWLVGTFSRQADKSFAFIIDKKNQDQKGKALRYGVGDAIGDYTVASILPDHVILAKASETASLRLKPSQSGGKSQPAFSGAGRSSGAASAPEKRVPSQDRSGRDSGSARSNPFQDMRFKQKQEAAEKEDMTRTVGASAPEDAMSQIDMGSSSPRQRNAPGGQKPRSSWNSASGR